MKKLTVCLFAACLLVPAFVPVGAAAEMKTAPVSVRDPFVLENGGSYYLYGTGLCWPGYGCRVSADLAEWSDTVRVLDPAAVPDACGDWWAPECHAYGGRFYLFATYRSAASGKRGTAVFVSDSPTGPFSPLSDGHITPKERDCIDGTLYIDGAGDPWIVYVDEWTSAPDGVGSMSASRLSPDLSARVGEPILLFRADDAPWAKGRITDGPFLYRTASGALLMLWSNLTKSGYAVGVARSSNGRIDGKWTQLRTPLYQKDRSHSLDGGHGMLFRGPDGALLLSIHAPNDSTPEEPTLARFVPVADLGFTLASAEAFPGAERLLKAAAPLSIRISSFCERLKRAFACG